MSANDFIKHEGAQCPVSSTAKVAYRTVQLDRHNEPLLHTISHIHRPVLAGDLNWSFNSANGVLAIGRIYDYKIVN